MQHNATQCNNTATHKRCTVARQAKVRSSKVTHCNAPQYTPQHTLQHTKGVPLSNQRTSGYPRRCTAMHRVTHTATHCKTLQNTATTHCNTQKVYLCATNKRQVFCGDALQHTATKLEKHCNTGVPLRDKRTSGLPGNDTDTTFVCLECHVLASCHVYG